MKLMEEKLPGNILEFFVFSDDIESVKESLELHRVDSLSDIRLHFVSGGLKSNVTSSLDEFILMTLFSRLIISNSTFSWWAAYLSASQNKTVIAPAFHPKFFDHYPTKKERKFKKIIIQSYWYPPEWIVLNPYKSETLLSFSPSEN